MSVNRVKSLNEESTTCERGKACEDLNLKGELRKGCVMSLSLFNIFVD